MPKGRGVSNSWRVVLTSRLANGQAHGDPPAVCLPPLRRTPSVPGGVTSGLRTPVPQNPAVNDVAERWTEFKQLSRALTAVEDETARLQMVVDAAPVLVPTCAHAGMTLNEKGGVVTRVSSDDVVGRANELQFALGEGPCLDVDRDQDTILIRDLAYDQRWSRWSASVHQLLSVGSMMSLLVYTDQQSYGALSVYATQGRRFEADDVAIAQGLAAHLAGIIATGREIDQLGNAMHSRTIIGQAQGILMTLLDIDADQAFDYLRRVSSESNRKLAVVAAEIARTRRLPPHS